MGLCLPKISVYSPLSKRPIRSRQTCMPFWRVNPNIKYRRMKGSGSWSMESLHFGALLDWESRRIVKQIDVEIKNVGCLQSFSPCSFWFNLGFPVWYGSLQTLRRRPVLLPSIWSRLQRETWCCGNRWWRRCRGRGGVWSYWIVRGSKPKIISTSNLSSNAVSRRPLLTASFRVLQTAMLLCGFQVLLYQFFDTPQSLILHLPSPYPSIVTLHLYLLGYPFHSRFYLTDDEGHRIYGYYALSPSVVEYQTAILRGDTKVATKYWRPTYTPGRRRCVGPKHT